MPCNPFGDCSEFVKKNNQTVTCSDKKSSTAFIYENRSLDDLTKYGVDGCLIDDNGSKCDYLLLNCTKKKSYFIELKGSDLIKAIEQIDRSINILHNRIPDFSVDARIVLTRVNTIDLKSTRLIKLENKLKKLNGTLKKQSRQMIEIN